MADIRRFSDNALIANGTSNNELGMTDIVPVQHTSGNNIDYKMSISQFQGTPVVEATYTTATSPTMAYNGTCKNFPDIGGKLVQGQHVLIKFLKNNTSTNVTKTTINLGGYTYELQLQGSAMPTGYIAANAVIDFTCLTATSDTTKTGVLVCQNSVSQVNSALTNYSKINKITITNEQTVNIISDSYPCFISCDSNGIDGVGLYGVSPWGPLKVISEMGNVQITHTYPNYATQIKWNGTNKLFVTIYNATSVTVD